MHTTGFAEIAERLAASIVHLPGGSGLIYSRNGLAVTNAHVIRSRSVPAELPDGRRVRAALVAMDASRDLALLQLAAGDLAAAEFADSNTLRPGQLLLAIGSPFGFRGALSSGVLHSVAPVNRLGAHSWVQAGLRLAPGNSGGPLADPYGRVVGINTMIFGELALAVPANAVRSFAERARAAAGRVAA